MFVRDFFENFRKTSGQLLLYCRLWNCVCLLGKSWKNHLLEDPGVVIWRCSIKKCVPKNSAKFTGKHLCQNLFFNKVANLRPATLLRKRLAQVLSCGFCEISKNTFFFRTPAVAPLEICLCTCVHILHNLQRNSKSYFFRFIWRFIPIKLSCNQTYRIK